MKHLINFIKGMLIGIANLIPGVSGGTMAVSMGVYEEIIDSIGNFFKKFKETFVKNMVFLIPIILGAGVGVIAFSKLLDYLLKNHEAYTKFAFMGLILGSIPFIFKKSNEKGFKKSYIIPFIITLAIGGGLCLLEYLGVTGSQITSFDLNAGNVVLLVIYGFIAAASMVIPGISGSFILLLLGVYSAVLSAVSNLEILILIPFAIGVGLGILLMSKLINYLLEHFHGLTYYAILGFILGSLPAIFPGLAFDITAVFSIVIFIVFFVISYYLGKLTNK